MRSTAVPLPANTGKPLAMLAMAFVLVLSGQCRAPAAVAAVVGAGHDGGRAPAIAVERERPAGAAARSAQRPWAPSRR